MSLHCLSRAGFKCEDNFWDVHSTNVTHLTLLQRDLADVTVDDWNNLPEVGDARNRKQRVSRAEK